MSNNGTNIALFEDLTADEVALFYDLATRRSFADREVIIEQRIGRDVLVAWLGESAQVDRPVGASSHIAGKRHRVPALAAQIVSGDRARLFARVRLEVGAVGLGLGINDGLVVAARATVVR